MRRKAILIASLCVIMLCGCARHYAIRLNNGTVIQTASKPSLDDRGFYVFRDSSGHAQQVNAMRVREIAPRGSTSTDKKFYPGGK